jgi:hypothetical protein
MNGNRLSTDEVSRLFFSQIKRISINAARHNASHAFSVTAPDNMEVSVC